MTLLAFSNAPEAVELHDVLTPHVAQDVLFHGAHFRRPREEYLHRRDVRHDLRDVSRSVRAAHHSANGSFRRVIDEAPNSFHEFSQLSPLVPKPGNKIPSSRARSIAPLLYYTIKQNSRDLTRANAPASAQSPPDPTLAGAPHNPARGPVGTARAQARALYSVCA